MASLAQCLAVSDGFQNTQELSKCVSRLGARFAFYTEAFARWKKRDAERLAAELLVSYRKLLLVHRKYEVQAQEARNEVDGVHELLRQTHGQLMQMHRALEKLLGRAGAKEKVEELEQNLKQGDDSGDVSANGNSSSSSGTDNNAASSDGATTSSSPPMDTSDEGEQKKGDDDDEMRGDDDDDTPTSAQPSSVNQALLADRKLVHELILNPQFQIPRDKDVEAAAAAVASEQSVAAMAVRVREAMTKAFWDCVVEANDIKTVLARTEELRTTFRDALGGGSGAGISSALSTLADQVDNALRPDQLGELMQDPIRNVHIIQARCNGVLDAIEQAEAPARAETTRAFRSDWAQRIAAGVMPPVQLIVAFLAFALDKVDELRSDVLNAHLGLLGAYMQRHGVEYEQKQLHARLSEADNLETTFPMTIKWLAMEMEVFVGQLDEAERSKLTRHDGGAFERFLHSSIWALVEKHIDGSASRAWPETFELDVARIRSCRDALDRIVIVSSLLALLQEYVARRNLATPAGFFSSVGHQLSDLLRSPGVSGAQLAAQATQDVRQLESSHSEDAERELQALEQRLLGSFAAHNPVFKLFFSRAARAFEQALVPQSSGESLHPSLAPFASEITEATSELRRLCQHNEKVHASLYNNIIKRLVSSA
ncbi:T-complex protein 11-like protein 2 [Phytophthora citrophthora]|uniref:T-complex protein 11-like protein 2 n=1 Tax=Phytophthora citrophthora TaxID=4793 RepID=A0AAD9GQV5_9STRA|nr:T-complex protein 11-like protein 2 [Phytophthora citrophthora]